MITKEQFLQIQSEKDVIRFFESRGFKCFQEDDCIDVEISESQIMEILLFRDHSEIEKKSRQYRLGRFCQLYISVDFEDWVFTRRMVEDGVRLKKYRFSKNKVRENSKSSFLQKLNGLEFGKLRTFEDLFVRKDITKKFYDEFKKLIDSFIKDIKGIDVEQDRRWYASVIINRLMFTYFIQHKELLGERDVNYLHGKLRDFAQKSKDTYYNKFLKVLFFEGFAKRSPREKSADAVLGKVPYLNGGLFQKHRLEEMYPNINISDKSFEKIFLYFDQWSWNLGDWSGASGLNPTSDNEINTEVLGYIFEKFTNQKQMGAYYTKEDITGYICKNTILPRLFDMAGGFSFSDLLKKDPDRYIYSALRHGTSLSLPKEIEKGISAVSERGNWNTAAPESFALPTETWREVIGRRKRYEEVKKTLLQGSVSIEDLITLNLDIIQITLDAVETGDLSFVNRFYECIRSITILDPTCGSGAFLFAALNILENLYEACLNRLAVLKADHPALREASSHANWKYFIYKSIILNNLYGVDIMEEAVEICKLRLFLQLISQVERNDDLPNLGIEPLPDIDFNIHAGNTLIGYTKLEDVESSLQGTLNFYGEQLKEILKKAGDLDLVYDDYRKRQSEESYESKEKEPIQKLKQKIDSEMKSLNDKLDRYLAISYGISESEYKDKKKFQKDFTEWKESHRPFHWIIEYFGIMKRGGFDVIVGNPPYVEYSKVSEYKVLNYKTEKSNNLYALTCERAVMIVNKDSFSGLIIPISIACSGAFNSLRIVIKNENRQMWFSHFSNRPGQLFSGAQNRLTIIILGKKEKVTKDILTTKYYRWDMKGGERSNLFYKIQYVSIRSENIEIYDQFPKVNSRYEISIIEKIKNKALIRNVNEKSGKYAVYWVRVPGYFCQFFLNPPTVKNQKTGEVRFRGELNEIKIKKKEVRDTLFCLFNSSLYYLFFCIYTDTRHLNPSDVLNFYNPIHSIEQSFFEEFSKLAIKLNLDYQKNKQIQKKSGLLIESIDSKLSKPIIDEIDKVLAKHYGFTEEELDYIINYDIKYRMGKELEGEE